MSFMISRPLTAEQRKILENKAKPSAEDIRKASDDLFMYLLAKVAELETKETKMQ